MGEFQRMTGAKLPASINIVVGSKIDLKLIPGKGEPADAPITISPPGLAKVVGLNVRKAANFATFSILAETNGSVRLLAGSNPAKLVAGPIAVNIEPKLTLPDAKSNLGMLARLLMAETPSPGMANYTVAEAEDAMTMMVAVVFNRLAKPSNLYASQNAKKLSDVVRAPGQFKGFQNYPEIDAEISKRIDETMAIANNGGDGRREKYKIFAQNVIRIARTTSVSDPNLTNLYFWRTAGSGSPAPSAKVYKTVLGNTFYKL